MFFSLPISSFLLLLSGLSILSLLSSSCGALHRPIHGQPDRFKLNHNHNARRPKTGPTRYYSDKRTYSVPRYVFAENSTQTNHTTTNSTSNSTSSHRNSTIVNSNSTSHSNSTSVHHHVDRLKIRNWITGSIVGTLTGIISGLLVSVLFRFLLNVIRGRYRSQSGPSIYMPKIIKREEDLAFLEKEEGLASLEVIGHGGCGDVYKAELPGNPPRTIAIKRIIKKVPSDADLSEEETNQLDKWMRQIKSEIKTVGYIRHKNLVPLVAHVSRPNCHYLIYEFMKNGSLFDVLTEAKEGRCELDWPARLKIADGIVTGLTYLHVYHKPHIIHRDLKPANILLDDDMEARIADFGLAKEMPDTNTHMTSSNVAGTLGYIAPEYHQTLKFTAKCDIYSFGIILAVLVMGKQPSDNFFQTTEEIGLVKWLRNCMKMDCLAEAIDPVLIGNGFEEQMKLVLRIACFCTNDDPKERPTSRDVKSMLSQIKR